MASAEPAATMSKPVTDWLIFIGGFMQDRSLAVSGMCGMAHEARDRYKGRGVEVTYEPWKSDWKSFAEWVFRWSRFDRSSPDNSEPVPPTIIVAAYSWGAGWGLLQLASHLAVRGLHINVAIACDGVRHIGWGWSHTLGISQALAYLPFWKLQKPESIDELHWLRQSRRRSLLADWKNGTTWLYGHEWVDYQYGKWETCSNFTPVPDYNHTNMDDAEPFRQKVFSLADRTFLQRAA